MFWVLAIALAIVAGLFLAGAARAGGAAPASAEAGALAVYRDQLAEIERDRERGLILPEEAEAAAIEVQRRMLRAGRAEVGGADRARRWPVLAAALAVPLAGGALYAATGTPGLPSVVLEERAEERARANDAQAAAALLARRIEDAGEGAAPGDRVALAQVLGALGRHGEAAEALAPLLAAEDVPSGVLTLWIEARVAAARGAMDEEVRTAVDRAIRVDPLNPAASYYLSYALETEGRLAAAREVLMRRLSIEPAVPPWGAAFGVAVDRLGARLDEAPVRLEDVVGTAPPGVLRRGPDAAAVAAAEEMTPEEREAMVRGMVDGLAGRLEAAPNDPGGWLELARARAVLGEAEAAREALARARPLVDALPEDAPERAALAALTERIGK